MSVRELGVGAGVSVGAGVVVAIECSSPSVSCAHELHLLVQNLIRMNNAPSAVIIDAIPLSMMINCSLRILDFY